MVLGLFRADLNSSQMNIKSFIFCLLLFHVLQGTAQTRYKEGYFIDNNGQATKCLIYDVDWLNNPKDFKYRFEERGEIRTLGLSDVKEFGVDGSRFVYAEVDIDTALQETKNLNYNRNPEWKKVRAFLKVLIEGKASLYLYKTPTLEKFLYSVDASPIEQLVYKEYLVSQGLRQFTTTPLEMRKNQMYIQQLKDHILCGNISDDELKRVLYKKETLERHFENFNTCHGGPQIRRARPKKINVFVTPGVDFGAVRLSDGFTYEKEYGNTTSARLGLMVEYVLAFNNGKWSMIVEPSYQSYKSGDVVNYQSLELPLGVRHSFFLTESSKLFLNAFFVVDLPLKYEIQFSQSRQLKSNTPSAGFAAGAGVNVKRFSLEVRKYFTRSIFGGDTYNEYFFVYDKFSIIVGFRLKK